MLKNLHKICITAKTESSENFRIGRPFYTLAESSRQNSNVYEITNIRAKLAGQFLEVAEKPWPKLDVLMQGCPEHGKIVRMLKKKK